MAARPPAKFVFPGVVLTLVILVEGFVLSSPILIVMGALFLAMEATVWTFPNVLDWRRGGTDDRWKTPREDDR